VDSTKTSSERLQKILPDAIAALHQLIEKHQVTEEEWTAVLAFLTEVGRQD
jgi:DNA-binding SARP family transcriptional activator